MKEADFIISGGTVLVLDKENTIIDDGAVAVAGTDIAAVGTAVDIGREFRGRRSIDARGSLVMPGLVNGHTHTAMTCFRGIADDMALMEWLNDFIFPAEAKNVDPELAYWGSLLACAEMIRSGTTTFCDMYIFEDETARAAREAGMRCLLGEVLFDFPSPNFQTPAEGLAYTERLLRKWAGDPLVNIFVEPHALYTCSPGLLKAAKRLADRYGAPVGMHLLENLPEKAQIQEKYGRGAVPFLREIGYLDERFIAFHGVCLDEEDMKTLAGQGCSVIHNPESNMKLASGVAPVPDMLAHGLTVGLGTDGCASNNNLDLFQEMDTAAKLHKVHRLDPTVMNAETVLKMATREGAKALGMGNLAGCLKPGMKADLILLGFDKPHLTPLYSPYSHLVYAANGSDVDTVFINGRPVMENRRLLTIDEEEAMARVRDIALRVRKSLGMPA
ncbi:MAG: 5-methylthioadenosine/S-adenosylhomocysteine deaminase [Syntrophaceae bacterium PtaB.Bin095]|jgi:5-methylthioadenosine/S-adenosylhomocysteine deaminase|nr:MAG: 5-methylthioadenosine/S-adenosylhomocysteine deaminase [Syntrophaceae bacterium PtaB.Bin095]